MRESVERNLFEDYRPGLINRLRALFLLKIEKYEKYIKVLKLQDKDLESGDQAALTMHQHLVDNLISEIRVLDKTIKPLEEDFIRNEGQLPGEILEFRASLKSLGLTASGLSRNNCGKLEEQLSELGARIPRVRYAGTRGYSGPSGAAPRYLNISV